MSAGSPFPANPLSFFENTFQAFLAAGETAGQTIEDDYLIAGSRVRVRYAGPVLKPFFAPALEHLRTDGPGDTDLTICCYDSNSTGINLPPLPWPAEDFLARGEIRNFNNKRIKVHIDLDAGMLDLLDIKDRIGLFAVRESMKIPYWIKGAPLRIILHWWLAEKGFQLTHAGAVGTEKGCVLLAGRGGSGKSTAALACLHSDLKYVSDDYCLLAAEPEPYAYSLYNTAKLNFDNLHRFPFLKDPVNNTSDYEKEKALFFVNDYFPEKIVAGLPAKALLIPHVSGRKESRIEPSSAVEALKALAPSTIFQLPGAGRKTFYQVTDVVRKLPCFTLEAGSDLTGIPVTIEELLEKLP